MKVVYLTWGETPRSFGVYGTQALGQFNAIAKSDPLNSYYFVAAVPLVHSGFVREKWKYFKELASVKQVLANANFEWLTLFAPQNFIYPNRFNFRIFQGFNHIFLKKKLAHIMPDIVHCRSYHAAWAALSVRRKFGFNYKIILDSRGLWPEEIALKRGFSEGSTEYGFLKSIEKKLVPFVDCTVSVSDMMHDHFVTLGSQQDFVVYLSSDTKKLFINRDAAQKNTSIRFCYVGALDDDTWHKPIFLLELFRKLLDYFPSAHLTVVTKSNHSAIRDLFNELPSSSFSIVSTESTSELVDVLRNQDIGLMSYFLPTTDFEKSLAKVVLAVKTVEYFSAGLPLVCNEFCGGAASFIEKYGLGVTYSPFDLRSLSKDRIEELLDVRVRLRCQALANIHFDYLQNAVKYLDIYRKLST